MKRGSSQLLLRASCFLYVLHGSSLALTFYSPFFRGDTLIYMDLCEPKSFEFLKIWRYMDIYEDTWQVETPTIPNFIYLYISLKSLVSYNYNRQAPCPQAVLQIIFCRCMTGVCSPPVFHSSARWRSRIFRGLIPFRRISHDW